jgi:RNA polymerase sigma-70 factor (ECF subfamily)
MPGNEDAILVEKALAGDSSAFETLFKKCERQVHALVLRIVRDPDDAQDIVQAVFTKAFEKLHTYDPKYQFFSWVYRIGLNESLNHTRRRRPMEEYESGVSAIYTGTPERDFRDTELAAHVGEAIKQLKMDYRLVLVLKHYHDFSYQEMSEILEVPEKTVKSRLFTARQQLKEILEKTQGSEG